MRWIGLAIVPATFLVACIDAQGPYNLHPNANAPGQKGGCKVGGTHSLWGGSSVDGLCNDGDPNNTDIVIPPVSVPTGGGFDAVVGADGSITIPDIAQPPQEAFLWIANTG